MIEVKYILTVGMVNEGTHTHQTVTTGPRNLVKVANELGAIRARLTGIYGNAGLGKVWIEVDGQLIDDIAMQSLSKAAHEIEVQGWKQDGGYGPRPTNPTEQARAILTKLAAQ